MRMRSRRVRPPLVGRCMVSLSRLRGACVSQSRHTSLPGADAVTTSACSHTGSLLWGSLCGAQGTIADGAPVVPISAQLKYNVDVVCEYIVKKIPVPVRCVRHMESHGHVVCMHVCCAICDAGVKHTRTGVGSTGVRVVARACMSVAYMCAGALSPLGVSPHARVSWLRVVVLQPHRPVLACVCARSDFTSPPQMIVILQASWAGGRRKGAGAGWRQRAVAQQHSSAGLWSAGREAAGGGWQRSCRGERAEQCEHAHDRACGRVRSWVLAALSLAPHARRERLNRSSSSSRGGGLAQDEGKQYCCSAALGSP